LYIPPAMHVITPPIIMNAATTILAALKISERFILFEKVLDSKEKGIYSALISSLPSDDFEIHRGALYRRTSVSQTNTDDILMPR
jgi:hypothetical protein